MNHRRPPADLDEPMRVIQWAMWHAIRPRPDTVWLYLAHSGGPGVLTTLREALCTEGIVGVRRSRHTLRIQRAACVGRFLAAYVERTGPSATVRLAAKEYMAAWARRRPRVPATPAEIAACVRAAQRLIDVIPVPPCRKAGNEHAARS